MNVVGDTANGFINAMLGGLQDKLAELIPQAIKLLETILQAPCISFPNTSDYWLKHQ